MALYRTRTHLPLPGSLILPAMLVLTVVFAIGLASAAGSGKRPSANANERLRELMTLRYEILQRAVKNSELMLKAGRVDVEDLRNLTIALYRAQADLCTTDADRMQVYEKLVDALSTQEEVLERQSASGRATEIQVDEGRVATLNARIDLERLRLGQPASRR
jgi:hypothetical protein